MQKIALNRIESYTIVTYRDTYIKQLHVYLYIAS